MCMTKCSETSSGLKTGVREGLATTTGPPLEKYDMWGSSHQQAPTNPGIIHLPCEHHPPCQMYLLSIVSTPVFKRPKWKGPYPQDENVDQNMIILGKLTKHVKPWIKLMARCISGKKLSWVMTEVGVCPNRRIIAKVEWWATLQLIQRDGEG